MKKILTIAISIIFGLGFSATCFAENEDLLLIQNNEDLVESVVNEVEETENINAENLEEEAEEEEEEEESIWNQVTITIFLIVVAGVIIVLNLLQMRKK